MVSISLCMIVKNEEKNIAKCLDSIKDIVDEIIVVDTGSTDKTKDITKKYTTKVLDFKWVDDFAKARNFSFSKATKEYIMWLDADDVLLQEDRKKLIELKKNLVNKTDVVMFKYDIGNGNFFYRERLLKAKNNYVWVSPIHEAINVYGNIIYSDITITHTKTNTNDPKRNLRIFQKMLSEGQKLDARQTFYYSRELYYAKDYSKAIQEYLSFFDMPDAWTENKISACLDLNEIYEILRNKEKSLLYLFKSFEYDIPRAEVCCKIAIHFMDKGDYKTAIYWLKEASKKNINILGGFCNKDCYDFIPYIQLCVCYYKIGDIQKAIFYNNKAGKIHPNNSSYLYNLDFFKTLQNKT